jgi:hypothetical protein
MNKTETVSFCLIKEKAVKTHWEVEVELHAFLTSLPDVIITQFE